MVNVDVRKEFAEKLFSFDLDAFCDFKSFDSFLDSVIKVVCKGIPESLFRYRSGSDNSIDAFENDLVFGSKPKVFNDVFECQPYVCKDDIDRFIKAETDFNTLIDLIAKYNQGFRDPVIESIWEGANVLDAFKQNKITKSNSEMIQLYCSYLRGLMTAIIEDEWNDSVIDFMNAVEHRMNEFWLACFSENKKSELMWGHYADGHKGFLLEYNSKDLLTCLEGRESTGRILNAFSRYCSIYPVVYTKNKYNISSILFDSIRQRVCDCMNLGGHMPAADALLPLKNLCLKSQAWEYEKEWRMFYETSFDSPDFGVVTNTKPKAVYLGINISEERKERLLSIAKRKGISCFQMVKDFESSNYGLNDVLL